MDTTQLTWRPHTERPAGPETALIAILLPDEDDKPEPALMTELHIWDRAANCWMSERGGMPIRHPVFWWLPAVEVLPSLPSLPQ